MDDACVDDDDERANGANFRSFAKASLRAVVEANGRSIARREAFRRRASA